MSLEFDKGGLTKYSDSASQRKCKEKNCHLSLDGFCKGNGKWACEVSAIECEDALNPKTIVIKGKKIITVSEINIVYVQMLLEALEFDVDELCKLLRYKHGTVRQWFKKGAVSAEGKKRIAEMFNMLITIE